MLGTLKDLLLRLRMWMSANERAHRNAKASACCSMPAAIYAASRRARGENPHE
ncbi:hypothetical protein PA01_18660 [Azoarcus sp. PA01]|nr:hypothetical protein PA01_18660 [Azoarcus sp. PA01]